jgi:hypothetical protein
VSVQDYRVNAEVRRLLVSRWVDVSLLQVGTTNGVVYILGHLDSTTEDPTRRVGDARPVGSGERVLQLAVLLDKDLRRVRDVRDVVFKLDNVVKRGGRWRTADGAIADSGKSRRVQIELRRTTERVAVESEGDNERG